MGHQVNSKHRPHRGSLGFWPRVRSKRQYISVHWKENNDNGMAGFPVYKAGMTHLMVIDNLKNSPNKGKKVFMPVTILETPPVKVIGVRFYKKTPYGSETTGEVLSRKNDKHFKRKLIPAKKESKTIDDYKDYDDIRLILQTQPSKINLKKTPEVFEAGLGGSLNDKLSYAKSVFEKEISAKDVLKEGMLVDINAVTTGKGTQGSVKRHGVTIFRHKGEKVKRGVQAIGPTSPRKVSWKVPQYGQMGYHSRVEYNKWIIKMSDKPEEVNPKGGLVNYGLVKGDYMLIKGSIAGPRKRMVILRKAIRPDDNIPKIPPQVKHISTVSRQGGRLNA